MSKKYSIGFLVGILALIALFGFAYRISYNRMLERQEAQEQDRQVQGEVEICYYIMALDDYVTVYEGDKKTVYEYTTIPVTMLPENLRADLKEGIKVTSLGQGYAFLENYSS